MLCRSASESLAGGASEAASHRNLTGPDGHARGVSASLGLIVLGQDQRQCGSQAHDPYHQTHVGDHLVVMAPFCVPALVARANVVLTCVLDVRVLGVVQKAEDAEGECSSDTESTRHVGGLAS